MKGKILKLLIIIIVVFNGACGTGVYEIVSRDQRDPDNFYVNVDSFSEENVMPGKICWHNGRRSPMIVSNLTDMTWQR